MKKMLLSFLLSAAMTLSAQAGEGRLLRFPTTNGTDVVFSYAGDLYKAPLSGGQAVRLTSHEGYEMFPRFSPDGKTIAFTGQYDGNTEVYSIPAEGGTPVRLTWTSTNGRDDLGDRMGPNNIVMGWKPDGQSILYRNRIGDGFEGQLWTVPADGGMSDKLPLPEGGFSCWSPDGRRLAYNRTMREFRTWKYYRGGQADDIWIWDGKQVENITSNDAQDIMPMWIGREIYFISDRDHWMNLFVYDTATKTTAKVTDFKEYDIKFPSTNGSLIVFENGGWLYQFDPATKQYAKIEISLDPEGIQARPERKDVSYRRTGMSLSPQGDRLAVTARGEVFSVPVKAGVKRNITRTPDANERDAEYSPDGRYIAYISDRTGETEVWLYDTQKETTAQLTDGNDTYIRDLEWAPDSKSLLYTDRKNRIVTVSVPDGAKTVVTTCPEAEFRGVRWSPDSRWITYTRPAPNEMSVVYVCNLATREEIPVTEKWYDASMPLFSADGKYLMFNATQDLNPIYSQVEWNYAYNNMGALYIALLTRDGVSPFLPSDGEAPKDGKPAPDKADKDKKDAPAEVRVDADGITGRILKIPAGTGWLRPVYGDEKGIWFGGRGGVQYFDFAKQEATQVVDGSMGVFGKKALVTTGGKTYVSELPRAKASAKDGIDLKGLYADIDWAQEWAQIFDEAWRAFRDGFYLENMHGIDWDAMKAKYEVLLPYVQCRLDLNYVIGEMIGELTVGHSYVSPGEYKKPGRVSMGLLGAEIVPAKNGTFQIRHILKGANYSPSLRSPLTEPGMDVKEGDYILAVDGVTTSSAKSFYELMTGKAGVLTELTVNAKPTPDGARKIVVNPIADEYPLYHYEWVQKNIAYVEKASKGRIGYIYIPDMGAEGLNEFVRYYYPQLDKEALIVDDRANGGGNVSPMIIERLLRTPYRMTMRRGSTRTGKVPEGTFYGPKVCLINKYSASDGDLFPWSFRANQLGELIGTRTWGGIVGISGSLQYMDGTDIRVPFFTNYDSRTGQWIIENHGVDPDIVIDNDPVQEAAGVDQQLDKAIEVLLKKLENYQPLPGVPAPRDWSFKEPQDR
ncbi:MAG: PD40 domain-containing protein [Bacteroidales bacterium]|nr:PD40 domain-containing protein [Bacteroidales bacterium]